MSRKIAMTTVRTVLNLLSHGLSYKIIASSHCYVLSVPLKR
ncbi:hypothetical protein HMPREF9465_00102 [Sutterella wadsworthensis 2_1_59BFAA]|uniref:Uncharacterized protein n=1 Tax=Sutterella wadsworthensis 2_1_59BFAA TaxID=742823 RepID=K1JXC2_9BURK|nr:hypothetical protein HMPREF9465_00102 [Sutterella wadsworthensis 2_1_59BFAA]